MNQFFRNIFNIGSEGKNRELVIRQCESAYKISFVMELIVIILGYVFLGVALYRPEKYRGYEMRYSIMYGLMIVLAMIVLLVFLLVGKNIRERYRLYSYACLFSAVASVLWALVMTYFEAVLWGQVNPGLFITIMVAMPIWLYLSPGVYIILDLVGFAGLLWLMKYMSEQNGATDMQYYNNAGYLIVLLALGLTFILMRKKHIKDCMKIEEQKAGAESLLKAQNHFFSNMSHEIRTPVNTIIGLNEMILREEISDEVAEDAEGVKSAGKILLQLVNDILDLSKLESGQMQITPVTYQSVDMISEIVNMFRDVAEKKGLEFKAGISPQLPAQLEADDVRIRQILVNVLENAIKYTRVGSVSLKVECRETDGDIISIIYSVSDTGIGVKRENMPYLFTAFKRIDEENNRKIEGTGLGLSIVKRLVDQMSGNITVNSIANQGTTFVIEIPQKRVVSEKVGVIDMKNKCVAGPRRKYNKIFEAPEAKVLIVDDNVSNLMVTEKLLRDTKVKIRKVTSGAEALAAALEDNYHVILMDDLMPEMSGVETLHKLRNQAGGLCRDSKVIACTAKAGNENRLYYEKEGFDGYVEKPVDGFELEKEIFKQLPDSLVVLPEDDENLLGKNEFWINNAKTRKHLAISTESVADLPLELIKAFDIDILYHKIHTDEGTFKDTLEIDQRGLLTYALVKGGRFTSGSPGVEEHEEFFAEALGRAKNLIHLTVSEKVRRSGHLVATEAAKAFDDVYVLDSMHLSSGTGLVVLEACRLANTGMSPEKIMEKLVTFREKVHTSFIVDSVDFLTTTGQLPIRLSSVLRALSARPIIKMRNGKITFSRILFESRQKAWETYISRTLKQVHKIDRKILFVTYVGLTSQELEFIRSEVEKRINFDTVYFQEASPAISVNCGPGTFGLLFQEV